MAVSPDEFARRTLAHYGDKFALHGETPHGVDWNGAASQCVQFEQLLRLLPAGGGFSINDLGCGYGALLPMLDERYVDVGYSGFDLNESMIEAAKRRFCDRPSTVFEVADRPDRVADFGLASGIFTLRLGRSDAECMSAMVASLELIDATSLSGFGFNCLTSYSDAPKMQDYLYYPDPCVVFDLCKRRFSRDVALLHDYGMYAFTILVRNKSRPVA